jgi:hydroxymethylpyrimidine/phosphomethylpyrimidine kinase
VLAIGGLDPSAGAGLGADLRAIGHAGAWGCAACAALTVQSTRGLRSVVAVSTRLLAAQVDEIVAAMPVRVVKTGALGSARNLAWAAERLHPEASGLPLVVDPVLQPTRWRAPRDGRAAGSLAGKGALPSLRKLARAATLLTPNVPEAEALLAARIQTVDDARDAAMALVGQGARAVLLKGGHLRVSPARGRRESSPRLVVDWLATREGVRRLEHPRVGGPEIHGTGCMLASLVAGRLALAPSSRGGRSPEPGPSELWLAVRWGTARLAWLRRHAVRVGTGALVLGPWAATARHRAGVRPAKEEA